MPVCVLQAARLGSLMRHSNEHANTLLEHADCFALCNRKGVRSRWGAVAARGAGTCSTHLAEMARTRQGRELARHSALHACSAFKPRATEADSSAASASRSIRPSTAASQNRSEVALARTSSREHRDIQRCCRSLAVAALADHQRHAEFVHGAHGVATRALHHDPKWVQSSSS